MVPGLDTVNHDNVGVFYDVVIDGHQDGKIIEGNLLRKEYEGPNPSNYVNIEAEELYLKDKNAFTLEKQLDKKIKLSTEAQLNSNNTQKDQGEPFKGNCSFSYVTRS